jgi:hypothetical protein
MTAADFTMRGSKDRSEKRKRNRRQELQKGQLYIIEEFGDDTLQGTSMAVRFQSIHGSNDYDVMYQR